MRLLMFMATAWAHEGHEHLAEAHEVTIPWLNIAVQAINLFFLVAILVYVLRHTVVKYFAHRASEYKEMVERAEEARREAEASRNEIQTRMAKLDASAALGVAEARQEAEQLRTRMLTEAKLLAEKLEQEAQRTTAYELERAKAELRHELLQKALHSSSDTMSRTLGSVEQKQLQTEFVDKIEVVGR